MKRRLAGFLTFSILSLAFLGCSGGGALTPAKVSGRITYKGSPIKGGQLSFVTADNTAYPGKIDSDGTYSANDLPAGDMVVTIDTEALKPKPSVGGNSEKYTKMQAAQSKSAPGKASAKEENISNYVKIPTKYNNAKTSPLQITLTRGRQVKDLELTD